MQAFKEPPADMVCKDKFLIQSTAVPAETTDEDITASMVSIPTLFELYPEIHLFGLSSISVCLFILGSFPKWKANTSRKTNSESLSCRHLTRLNYLQLMGY